MFKFAKRILSSSQAIAPSDPEDLALSEDEQDLAQALDNTAPEEVEAWYTYHEHASAKEVDGWSTIKTPVEPDNAPGVQPQSTLLARLGPGARKMADLAKYTYSILNKVVVDPAIIEHGPNKTLYVEKRGRKYKVVEMGGKYFLNGEKLNASVGEVEGRIKQDDEYDWFKYTGNSVSLPTRFGTLHLFRGDIFGVRPSSNGKHIRFVLDEPNWGINKVVTLPYEIAQKLGKRAEATKPQKSWEQ